MKNNFFEKSNELLDSLYFYRLKIDLDITDAKTNLIDSFIYIGSALAGVLGGVVSQYLGSTGLFVSWTVVAMLSAACCFMSGTKKPMQALEKYSN